MKNADGEHGNRNQGNQQRLFIAARLPEEYEETLLKAQNILKQHGSRISLTKRENLHLTVCFIGEVPEPEAERIRAWFRQAKPDRRQPYRIQLDHYGEFKTRDGLTVWAGLRTDPELARLAGDIGDELRSMGFAIEKRPWKAHITLARRAELSQPLEDIKKELPLLEETSVPEICLFLSEFTRQGMRYTPLARWGFEEP